MPPVAAPGPLGSYGVVGLIFVAGLGGGQGMFGAHSLGFKGRLWYFHRV